MGEESVRDKGILKELYGIRETESLYCISGEPWSRGSGFRSKGTKDVQELDGRVFRGFNYGRQEIASAEKET